MSETKNDGKTWRANKIWIKDVLSKSGTELMEITPSTKNGSAGHASAGNGSSSTSTTVKNGNSTKKGKKDFPTNMVYYQSTPLIVKTEQPSQAQFCSPLRTGTSHNNISPAPSTITLPVLQNSPHNYTINNGAVLIQQQQQQQQQQQEQQQEQQQHLPQQSSSISNGHNTNFLSNVKLEMLTPLNAAPYPTSSSSSTLSASACETGASAAPPTGLPTSSIASNPNGNSSPIMDNGKSAVAAAAAAAIAARKANKPQFKCEQCGMIFGSKSAHTSHTKSHAKTNADLNGGNSTGMELSAAIEVNEAGVPIGIPKTPLLKPNVNGVAGGDPYQCNVCQKTFAVPARLIRHYRTHTGERPFECEFCHKLFSVKENLQVHRRIHTKERPYKCDVCGRAFEHSGKLHRHMRIHTGERPHKCSVCEKTFIQSGQLVIHMRTHTGEKPYKCPVEGCGKGFTCSKQLKVHSRTHTGEKPYHCDICFRDFGYNHVLKLHRVQHYGSKCYKCTICDETFKSKKEMEAHIKGHGNELPDDEEEQGATVTTGSGNGSGQASSISSGSGGDTNSAPNSPQSTASTVTVNSKIKKPRQQTEEQIVVDSNNGINGVAIVASDTNNVVRPKTPSSPSSTLSPSSSLASASRLSASSPFAEGSVASSHNFDVDYHSRDSGVASAHNTLHRNVSHINMATHVINYGNDELPTDLSVTQQHISTPYYQQKSLQANSELYTATQQSTYASSSAYARHTPTPQSHQANMEPPTINPALLEAATIASNRDAMLKPREEDVTQAALQIMELHRSQNHNLQQQPLSIQSHRHEHRQLQPPAQQQYQSLSPSHIPQVLVSSSSFPAHVQYEEQHRETQEGIEQYKRNEFAKQNIQKRYAPVPKFESSFLNNEIIVRQVEAAIAPLHNSTESSDRSSSPESDTMVMADRDVMTLPLRKRKLYMNDSPSELLSGDNTVVANNKSNLTIQSNNGDVNPKVMRMSSVIQFAKAV